MADWAQTARALADFTERQVFFVGGAPRSGTTWLQLLLDSHPEISCAGEGLFRQHLADPLDVMVASWQQAVAEKNRDVFAELEGYPPPVATDADFLLAGAILQSLARQSAGKPCRAVGEKTPENVFLFPRLKRLLPTARFVGMARDPRDVLASAWHFFHRARGAAEDDAAKVSFIQSALPSINAGTRAMLALAEQYPTDCMLVTYERLLADTVAEARELFRFLRVSDEAGLVADCAARSSFAALAGTREQGTAREGSFFRKGIAGDWRATFTPAMSDLILAELDWAFPRFGWRP